MRKLMVGVAVVAVSAGIAPAQDIAAGERSFQKCRACHDVGQDARNKIGPKLNGLAGGRSGMIEDYSYTDANKNAGITWNEETFKDYIKDPRAKMPGTKMAFSGIQDEKEATDLWTYLKQFGPDGMKQ
jgi:cytochrome c